MNECRAGLRRRIRWRSASTASTGDSVRVSYAWDSSATVAHTGSIVGISGALLTGSVAPLAAHDRRLARPVQAAYRCGVADTAEVLIIGAGIMGVSTAYHLARLGVGPVVVL